MNSCDRRVWLKQAAKSSFATAILSSCSVAAEEKKPIRFGQIGTGHAHASKLQVYRASSDYELVGVVEEDPDLRKRAESIPAFRNVVWMSREELLSSPGLSAVLVETEVKHALDVAENCLAAGKHIHLDKPAGESLAQFRRLLDQAEQKKLIVQMGYMYRYNPAVLLLKEFLRNGWLGDVFEVHTVMSKVLPPASRLTQAEYRGGMMFELGCHILDLVIGVLGEPTKVSTYSQHASEHSDTLQDNMLAVLTYPRAIATVKSTAMEVEGMGRRHFVVCGTEGTFHIQPLDNPSARIALSKSRGPYRAGLQEITFPKFDRYVADAADMAQIIRGAKSSDFTYHHDWVVQKTLLKACGLSTDGFE